MGVDHGGDGGDKFFQNLERGGLSPHILSCCKILSTRLLALQCKKMCLLPLQQDFYGKSRQNSSHIYAYAVFILAKSSFVLCATFVVNKRTYWQPRRRSSAWWSSPSPCWCILVAALPRWSAERLAVHQSYWASTKVCGIFSSMAPTLHYITLENYL